MSIAARVASLRSDLSRAKSVRRCEQSFPPRVIAVSKTRSPSEIRRAASIGLADFGENYVQEALPKIQATSDLGICWHFIGRIQSNKARDVAQHFQWIHTLDRAKVAQRLSDSRSGEPLNVCVQIDLEEDQRYGVKAENLASFIDEAGRLPNLRLRGLMCMPAPGKDEDELRGVFQQARQHFDAIASSRAVDEHWDTLSMGMSGDFLLALEEGATCVRIGTRIFGPRHKAK